MTCGSGIKEINFSLSVGAQISEAYFEENFCNTKITYKSGKRSQQQPQDLSFTISVYLPRLRMEFLRYSKSHDLLLIFGRSSERSGAVLNVQVQFRTAPENQQVTNFSEAQKLRVKSWPCSALPALGIEHRSLG